MTNDPHATEPEWVDSDRVPAGRKGLIPMQRITSLTPQQDSAMAAVRDEWIAIGRSTEPADRPAAETAIAEIYRVARLAPPRVVWCGSPLGNALTRASVRASVGASVRASVWDSVRDSVWDSVWASVRASVWDSVRDSVRASVGASVWDSVWDSVRASVGDSVRDSLYGQHDANWLAFYDFFRRHCGLVEITAPLVGLASLARAACWALPHEHICWVSERPSRLLFAADGLTLHSDSGPSVEFPDGWALWHVNGIAVDEQIVMRPETQSVAQIDGEKNADVRAVRIERFGWLRYIKESGAAPVDESKNFVTGCPEALYRMRDGSQRLVAVCPTGRTFVMGVPASIETCEQAQRWLAPKNVNIIAAT